MGDLFLQLSRYSKTYPYPKLDTPCEISETLTFMDTKYHLSAVGAHQGSTTVGHYWAYAKRGEQNTWYKLDDTTVNEIKKTADVKKMEQDWKNKGYYFLYRRKKKLNTGNAIGMENVGGAGCFLN